MLEVYNNTVIKSLSLFLLSLIIGTVSIIFYVKIATAQAPEQYETPTAIQTKQSTTHAIKHAFFSIERAPSDSLRGTISTMSGAIEWQSRSATQPSELKNPYKQIQQGELLQTDDTGLATVQFQNCCSLMLSSNTTINFVQTLPTNIVIAQTNGSAEYIVTNTIPLAIRSLDLLVNIQDGDIVFTISKTKPIITIAIKKGVMQASFNDVNYNSTVIPVTTGETLIFNDTTREANIE